MILNNTPEEREVLKRSDLVKELSEQLSSRELFLTSLKDGISRFQNTYANKIGRLYAELDRLDYLISKRRFEIEETEENKEATNEARIRANQSAKEAGISPPEEESQNKEPASEKEEINDEASPELKKLFRVAAMRFHPDRATSESERIRRTAIMAQLNVAYEKRDFSAIETLIQEAGSDPEEVIGDDIASQLVRLIRREAQIKKRLDEIDEEERELKEDDVYVLWQSVKEAEELGADPLGELAATLKVQIAEKKVELESLQI